MHRGLNQTWSKQEKSSNRQKKITLLKTFTYDVRILIKNLVTKMSRGGSVQLMLPLPFMAGSCCSMAPRIFYSTESLFNNNEEKQVCIGMMLKNLKRRPRS